MLMLSFALPVALTAAPCHSSASPADSGDAYAKLIPPSAITSRGLLITHVVGDKLYFELPKHILGKEMYYIGRFARGVSGGPNSEGGQAFANGVIEWERRGNRVLL